MLARARAPALPTPLPTRLPLHNTCCTIDIHIQSGSFLQPHTLAEFFTIYFPHCVLIIPVLCLYLKYYLSHTRDLLFSKALARASAPASPILLPQSLATQEKVVNENAPPIGCMKIWREIFTLKTAVKDCISVPLPVVLLLLQLYYCCRAWKKIDVLCLHDSFF